MANTEITRADVKKGFSEIPGQWNKIFNLFTWDFLNRRLNAGAIGRSVEKHRLKGERGDAALQREKALMIALGEVNGKYIKDVYGPTYHDSWVNQYDIRVKKNITTTGWIPVGSEYNSPFAMDRRTAYLGDFDEQMKKNIYSPLFQEKFKAMQGILFTPDANLFEQNGIQVKDRISLSEIMEGETDRFYQLPFVQQFLLQGPRPKWKLDKNGCVEGGWDVVDAQHRKAVDFELFQNAGGMQLLAIQTRYMQTQGSSGRCQDWIEEVSIARWRRLNGNLINENHLVFGFGDEANGGLLGYNLESMAKIYDVAISGIGKNGQKLADMRPPAGTGEETEKLFKLAAKFSEANDDVVNRAFDSSNPGQLLQAFYQDGFEVSGNLGDAAVKSTATLGTQLQAMILSSGESNKSKGYSQVFQARLAARVDEIAQERIRKNGLTGREAQKELDKARQIKNDILHRCQQRNSQDTQYMETKTNPLQIANETAVNFCFYGERGVYGATISKKNSLGLPGGKDISNEIMELLGGQHWGLGLNTEALLKMTSVGKNEDGIKRSILTVMEKNGWYDKVGIQECQKIATRILTAATLLARGEVDFEGFQLNDIMKEAKSANPDYRSYMLPMLYEVGTRKHLEGADKITADWVEKTPEHAKNLAEVVQKITGKGKRK